MTLDSLDSLVELARRQRRIQRWVTAYTIVWIVVMVPVVWALFRLLQWSTDPTDVSPFSWEWDVLRRALVSGSFWLRPAQAIFQAPSLEIADQWGAVATLLALLVGIAYLAVWVFYAPLVLGIVAFERARAERAVPTGLVHLPEHAPIAVLLFPALEVRAGREVGLPGESRRFVVHNLGGDVVIETVIEAKVPAFFVDSHVNRIERRGGIRLILPKRSEVVLDGTTRETSRIYLASSWTDSAAVLFPPAVTSLLVKELSYVELTGQDNSIAAIVPASNATDERELELLLGSIGRLADAIDAQTARARALPGRRNRSGGMPVRVEKGQLRWRRWSRLTSLPATPAVAVISAIIAGLGVTFLGEHGSTGDMVAVTVVSLAVFAWTSRRFLRRLIVLDPRAVLFSPTARRVPAKKTAATTPKKATSK